MCLFSAFKLGSCDKALAAFTKLLRPSIYTPVFILFYFFPLIFTSWGKPQLTRLCRWERASLNLCNRTWRLRRPPIGSLLKTPSMHSLKGFALLVSPLLHFLDSICFTFLSFYSSFVFRSHYRCHLSVFTSAM